MICFYVQGGGLGHLVRIDKVIKKLGLDKKQICIITPSLFTYHFPEYTFVTISWQQSVSSWQETITNVFKARNCTYCYIDTFPLGIKGELASIYKQFPKIEFIYIARILQWEKYCAAINLSASIKFKKVLQTETLYQTHQKWIHQTFDTIENINLIFEQQETPIRLHKEPYIIVLHSGGTKDVLRLCERAARDFNDTPKIRIAVCTQVPIKAPSNRFKIHQNIFGVHRYLYDAAHIYTAAGFNTVLELSEFKHKHTIIPIEKMYDDQFFRAKNMQ